MNTLAIARQLETEIMSLGLEVVTALSQDELSGHLDAGSDALLISPPSVTYETDHVAEAKWLVLVVSATDDKLTAWERLDGHVQGLIQLGTPDETAPAEWVDLHGRTWPAMTLTYLTHHDL